MRNDIFCNVNPHHMHFEFICEFLLEFLFLCVMRGFIFPGKRKMTVGMWVCLYVMREFGFQSFVFESNLNAIILQKGVML